MNSEKYPEAKISQYDVKKALDILYLTDEMARWKKFAYYLYQDRIDRIARSLYNKKLLSEQRSYLGLNGYRGRSKYKNLIHVVLPLIKKEDANRRVDDFSRAMVKRNDAGDHADQRLMEREKFA